MFETAQKKLCPRHAKNVDLLSKAGQQTEGSFGILNHTVSPCRDQNLSASKDFLFMHGVFLLIHWKIKLEDENVSWIFSKEKVPKFKLKKKNYYFIHITGGPETAPGSELGLASVEPSLRSGDVAAVEGRLPRKSWKKSTSSDLGEPRKVVFIGILIMVYEIIPI